VQTHTGHRFLVLEPSISDLIRQAKRLTQIMYPKDIGYVLLRLNMYPGRRVIEAGTGSGGLTMALARTVQPNGHVYSYEQQPEILDLARQNLARLGLEAMVTFTQRDIGEGFDQTDVDALFLDVRSPWAYLDHVGATLKDSGFFGAIVPTTNQVTDLLLGLEGQEGFGSIEVEEVLVRPYKPVPGRLRPADRMVAHTGYLVFARKVNREVVRGGYWADRKRRKYEELKRAAADDDEAQADAVRED